MSLSLQFLPPCIHVQVAILWKHAHHGIKRARHFKPFKMIHSCLSVGNAFAIGYSRYVEDQWPTFKDLFSSIDDFVMLNVEKVSWSNGLIYVQKARRKSSEFEFFLLSLWIFFKGSRSVDLASPFWHPARLGFDFRNGSWQAPSVRFPSWIMNQWNCFDLQSHLYWLSCFFKVIIGCISLEVILLVVYNNKTCIFILQLTFSKESTWYVLVMGSGGTVRICQVPNTLRIR